MFAARIIALVAILISAQASALPPVREDIPVREARRGYVGFNTGWNSLAGMGLLLGFHPHARITLLAGSGLGIGGLRLGTHVRYNFRDESFTPYVGAGLLAGLGTWGDTDVTVDGTSSTVSIQRGFYAQGLVGLEYAFRQEGFTFGLEAGYSQPLGDYVRLTGGDTSAGRRETLSALMSPHGVIVGLHVGMSL